MESFTPEQRRGILQRVLDNPKEVDGLSEDQIAAAKQEINHLATAFTDSQCFANLTIVGMRDQYLRGFYTTSIISYIFREAFEYEDDSFRRAEMASFAKETANLPPNCPELASAVKARDERIDVHNKTARDTIGHFLEQAFIYNPDRHVRGAHLDDEGRATPDRIKQYANLHARVNAALTSAPEIRKRLENASERAVDYARGVIMSTKTHLDATIGAVEAAHDSIVAGHSADDALGLLLKQYSELTRVRDDVAKLADPLSAAESVAAARVNPPAELFYQVNRYITNNYEYLRVITDLSYPTPADIEFGVTLHSVHDTEEAAAEFRDVHQSEFALPVQTVASGGMTLFGPFKQNRDKVTFYNKNTRLLEEMNNHQKADARLADDIMKKTMSRDKRKNIEDVGADDADLAEYKKVMSQAADLGAKPGLTAEDREQLAKLVDDARDMRESMAVPDDAIQYKIFSPVENADGVLVGLDSTIAYTQAEAPIHLDPAGPQEYQPVRQPGETLNSAYKKETVIVAGKPKVLTTLKKKKDVAPKK